MITILHVVIISLNYNKCLIFVIFCDRRKRRRVGYVYGHKKHREKEMYFHAVAHCLVVLRGIWYMLCFSLLQVYIVHIVSGSSRVMAWPCKHIIEIIIKNIAMGQDKENID